MDRNSPHMRDILDRAKGAGCSDKEINTAIAEGKFVSHTMQAMVRGEAESKDMIRMSQILSVFAVATTKKKQEEASNDVMFLAGLAMGVHLALENTVLPAIQTGERLKIIVGFYEHLIETMRPDNA